MAAAAYAVFGPFADAYQMSYAQSFPLSVAYFGHDRGLQFAGANWSGPSRTKEKTKRKCKGRSDMPMPMPKNVPRRAGAKT